MSLMFNQDTDAGAKALELATRERQIALSTREWKHRLAGYGFSVRDTDAGLVLETLPHHVAVCLLPTELGA